jgi:hypothetical protein
MILPGIDFSWVSRVPARHARQASLPGRPVKQEGFVIMKKMIYVRPSLKVQGSLENLTLGTGWRGNADSLWIFSWGQPKVS